MMLRAYSYVDNFDTLCCVHCYSYGYRLIDWLVEYDDWCNHGDDGCSGSEIMICRITGNCVSALKRFVAAEFRHDYYAVQIAASLTATETWLSTVMLVWLLLLLLLLLSTNEALAVVHGTAR